MADTVEYVVRIVGLGGGEDNDDNEEKKGKEPDSGLSSGLNALQKALHPVSALTAHRKDESFAVYWQKEALKDSIDLVETSINYSLNRYYRMSEDYISQNYLSNISANINRAKSFASSSLSGALAGAHFGTAGAIAGAIVGGTTNVLNQAIQYNNLVANFNASMNASRIETSFRARRAGLYDGGKGTEN